MTVYGDIVVAVNTLVDFLILLLGARLCGYPAKPWRCLLAGFLGGIFALATFFPLPGIFSSFPGQILCFALMTTLAYGFRRRTVRPAVMSFLCSAALAGCVFLITQIFSIGALYFQGGVYYPIGTRVLLLFAGIFYLAATLLAANSLRHGKNELYSVEIRCGDRKISVTALYDTGNTLTDPIGGRPVVILEGNRALELLPGNRKKEMFLNPVTAFEKLCAEFPERRFSLLPYRAVGVEGGMLVALSCKILLRKREESVLVAISPTKVSDGGAYEALIGGSLI